MKKEHEENLLNAHIYILHSYIYIIYSHYRIITYNALVNCCYLCFKFFPIFKGHDCDKPVCGEGVCVSCTLVMSN